uniref:Uncharacterized protein n=1 Tax=viral metagenome TaxID=1070528 RepID=A0A6C0IWU1_9ZZZZ
MDRTQINKELELLGLKNKLLITLKYYLFNTPQMELSCFYRILELLKQKYTDANDFNFVEQGIRRNLQNYNNNLPLAISNISSYIYNCNNEYLLKDLLNNIDTGINYHLTNRQDALTKLIIENTNITAETGNEVVCLREDIKSLL